MNDLTNKVNDYKHINKVKNGLVFGPKNGGVLYFGTE